MRVCSCTGHSNYRVLVAKTLLDVMYCLCRLRSAADYLDIAKKLKHQADSTVSIPTRLLSEPPITPRYVCTLVIVDVVERSSSAVESRTRNREIPGSNSPCYRFEVLHDAPVNSAV